MASALGGTRVGRDGDGRSGADLLLEPGPDHAELGVPVADQVRSDDRAVRRPEHHRDGDGEERRPDLVRPGRRPDRRARRARTRCCSARGSCRYSVQQQTNRGGVVAGTTFYIVDAKTGAVLASKDIGSDGVNETNNNCATDNGAAGCQKSKNALMSDPVATGPTDSRYVTRTYIGDLDGNIWRFDFSLTGGVVGINATTKLYSAGADQPIYNSMATVTVGTKQYVFIGTGSDLLPQTDKNTIYRLLGVLDNGATGSKTFEKLLQKTGERLHDHIRRASDRVPGGRRRHRVLHDDAC